MIVLLPTEPQWINATPDDPADLCAHGGVDLRIGDEPLLIDPASQGFCVSAAALYLMRSLETPHPSGLTSEPLFPCCGHAMYAAEGSADVDIVGCGNGEDFEVHHDAKSGSGVTLRRSGREWHVGREDWRAAVFAFADAVSAFYARCSPKQPVADDEDGWAAFRWEWARRRGLPLGGR